MAIDSADYEITNTIPGFFTQKIVIKKGNESHTLTHRWKITIFFLSKICGYQYVDIKIQDKIYHISMADVKQRLSSLQESIEGDCNAIFTRLFDNGLNANDLNTLLPATVPHSFPATPPISASDAAPALPHQAEVTEQIQPNHDILLEAEAQINSTISLGLGCLNLGFLGINDAILKAIFEKNKEKLKRFKKICLSGNKLTTLPSEISTLTTLESLDLSNNELATFPSQIGTLKTLSSLDLSDNQLATLPSQIGTLTTLSSLNLRHNQLTTLPSQIGTLTTLSSLNLSHNQLNALPSQIGTLTTLGELDLSYNQLNALPSQIGTLTTLSSLNLRHNQLTTLPSQIGTLTTLSSLNLSDNQLTTLPLEIGTLTTLGELYLSHNQLTALPLEVGNLVNLSYFDVSGNLSLGVLPMGLGNASNITYINIENTLIPATERDNILASCRERRSRHGGSDLTTRLTLWQRFSGGNRSLSAIHELPENQKGSINEWLLRLEKTNDFRQNQSKLAAVVCHMLDTVVQDEGFRDVFFAQLNSNNEACGDRAAMAFNELFGAWKLATLPSDSSLRAKLDILIASAKATAFRTQLANLIAQNDPHGQETVEIYLYYETQLKHRVGLLSCMEGMLYTPMGSRAWVNEDQLVKATNALYINDLKGMELFKKIIESDATYIKTLTTTKAEIATKMEQLDESEENEEINGGLYLASANALQKQMDDLENGHIAKWLTKQLAS
jgi:Leucine-rich repeat (LRR) protein